MSRAWSLVIAGALGLPAVAGACASEHAPAPEPIEEELTFEVLHVGSDGTGELAARRRLDALPASLAAGAADVLCLQGVGAPSDRAQLRSALAATYPVSLDLPTDDDTPVDDPRDATGVIPPPETKAPCADLDIVLDRVLGCLASRCQPAMGAPLSAASCLANDLCAPDSLFPADPERRCRSCVANHARSGSSLTEISKRCREQIHPLSLHGQHGMLILSKLPLSSPSIQVLPAEGTRRAVIGATVTTPRGAHVDVFCASLGPTQASTLPSDPRVTEPYPGPYGAPRDGWLRENELQIDRLGAQVAARRGARPAVVLGNFGASAEIAHAGNVVLPATAPISAARLDALFAPGIAPSYEAGCTICVDNPLVHDEAPSFRNRIYLAGLPSTAVRESGRTYLGEVVPPDPTASSTRLPLSMQYGFRSRIAIPRP